MDTTHVLTLALEYGDKMEPVGMAEAIEAPVRFPHSREKILQLNTMIGPRLDPKSGLLRSTH
jgi:hypothetical protein